MMAICNGISVSYFAEGSFYLIKGLGLLPSKYGLSFISIVVVTMMGGMLSKKLHNAHPSESIMGYGPWIIATSAAIFSGLSITTYSHYKMT